VGRILQNIKKCGSGAGEISISTAIVGNFIAEISLRQPEQIQ
jgi:hypothetical protein